MTSRLSFSKLLKEEWRHHLVSIFATVLIFLAEILFFYFDVQNVLRLDATYLFTRMESIAKPDFSALLPVIVLAVVLAADYFSYLHSQKKIDFYMSLPIRRNTQFLLGISVSLTIFIIPCVLASALETGLVLVTGYGNAAFLKNMLWNLICKCLAFVVTWVTMSLAVIITGHLAIALMGFGAICAYVPLFLYELYPTFGNLFYNTFMGVGYGSEPWYYFSPICLLSGLTNSYLWQSDDFSGYLIATIVFTLLVGLLAWFLYQKRPAEAAGKAMAFEKVNSLIRFLIVIPLALYCGYFLDATAMAESRGWLVAGTVIGAVLLHGIMESIFDFDPRSMLAKKKQLLVTIGICLGILAGFHLTTDMYNAYIPAVNDVKSVKLTLYDNNVRFYDLGEVDGISGEQIQNVIKLAERMILQNGEELQLDAEENGYALGEVAIEYEMVNGSKKGRRYDIYTENAENRALLDQIVATEDFKEEYFAIYNIQNDSVTEMSLENSFESEKLWFSADEQAEFLDIYRKELAEMTFTEMEEETRLAQLVIKYGKNGSYEDNCFICESFDETIAFLEARDIFVENPMDNCEIISVELLDEEYDEMGNPLYVVTDQELLNSMKDEFVLTDLYGLGYVDCVKDSQYAYAEVKIGNRIDSRYLYIREPEVEILKQAAD